jgi:hypothetical protein
MGKIAVASRRSGLAGGLNMPTTTKDRTEAALISGVTIPDTKLAQEATELVRDTEHSCLSGSLASARFHPT